MSGVDPTIEAGLVNFGFFLKDRRVWIIDESRIIQGAKIYTSYLPGDTFAICLQKGSEKKKVCVHFQRNNATIYVGGDFPAEEWEPCGFGARLEGKAGVIGQCAWLSGKTHDQVTDKAMEWRNDLRINTTTQMDGKNNTFLLSPSDYNDVKSTIMTAECPVVADAKDIHGVQFRIEDVHYGEKVRVMAGLSFKENVKELEFPKFEGRPASEPTKKKGSACTIL